MCQEVFVQTTVFIANLYNKLRFLLLKPQESNTGCYNSRKKERNAQKRHALSYLNVSGEQIFDALDGLPLPFLGDSGIKLQRR